MLRCQLIVAKYSQLQPVCVWPHQIRSGSSISPSSVCSTLGLVARSPHECIVEGLSLFGMIQTELCSHRYCFSLGRKEWTYFWGYFFLDYFMDYCCKCEALLLIITSLF